MIWECHTLTTNPGDTLSPPRIHQARNKSLEGSQAPFTQTPICQDPVASAQPGTTNFILSALIHEG